MSDPIASDLADLAGETLTAQPGTLDAFGAFVASGSSLAIPCYIEGSTKLVRDANGQEVVSSVQVYTFETNDLTVEGFRYTLPSRFTPNEDLRAIGVNPVSDENGAHHEEVVFP